MRMEKVMRMTRRQKMNKMIRVMIFPVGKDAFVTRIEDSLHVKQWIVGGYIETAYTWRCGQDLDKPWSDSNLCFMCHEEGKLLRLPFNLPLVDDMGKIYDLIAGPCYLTRMDSEGNDIDITDDDIEKFKDYPEATKSMVEEARRTHD